MWLLLRWRGLEIFDVLLVIMKGIVRKIVSTLTLVITGLITD